MARKKKTPTLIDSGEVNDLKEAIGSLPLQFDALLKSNEKLVEKVIGLTKGITDLGKSISKVNPGGKQPKAGKPGSGQPDPKEVENVYKKNIDSMFRGITGKFGQNLDKMFGGRIQKKIDDFADRLKDGAVKGKFSGTGYYDKEGKQLSFSGKIPKGAKQITSKAEHTKMFGGIDKFGGGKSGAAGMLQKAGSSLLRGGAGLLRAAGPIGAAFSVGMQVVDYFNSGKAAQDIANIGAVLGRDTTEATKAAFTASKKYREIQADFNILQPVQRENQKRMDMLEFTKQSELDRMGFSQQIVKDEYNRRFENEKDWLNFAHSQAMANIDAEHARRKSLFMAGMQAAGKYIGVSERALNAIGSSAEAVMNAISSVGKNLGASVGDMLRMSTAAAGVSKLLGASAEDVLGMGNTFRLMNKSSLEVGTNLTTGIKAFADKNGVMASVIMKDMTDSSAEIYKFSSGTAENFAKQAVQLNKMGVSMNAMMKASDTMVLNYKDSIKAEMGLSAMLGRNVDLSETRAKLMAGDQAGAAESLRGALGGMDVGAMNAFQKQQLSQATGMDIEQLMSLQQGGEGDVKGTLEQRAAEKTGKDIANGALKQDVANEAAKIAAEQAFRAKMLKFEQDERKGMLMLEQMQRLENLAIEQKWRLKLAAAEKEGRIDEEIAKMQAEAATTTLANIFQDASNEYKQALNKDASLTATEISGKLQAFDQANADAQSYLNKLILDGVVNSKDAQSTMIQLSTGIAKGQTFTEGQINEMLAREGAFETFTKKKSEELAAQEAALAQAETAKEEASLNWFESATATVGSWLSGITGDDSLFGYGAADLNRESETAAAVAELEQSMDGLKDISTQYKNINAQYQPELKNIAVNDHNRGIAFQKQYEYQAKISDANVRATYAVVDGITQLAAAQGKPINIDSNGIYSTINRLSGRNYLTAV